MFFGCEAEGRNHEFGSVRSGWIDGLSGRASVRLDELLVLIWDEPESLILAQSERWRHA